jgi:uncharacterized peroxidase-related enzyme
MLFSPIEPQDATVRVSDLLEATQRQLGRVPNLYRAMANSPQALAAYLSFRGALQGGSLDHPTRERIALVCAQSNECDYCIAAHAFRASKLGLSAEDIASTCVARSNSPKVEAALRFVEELIEKRGKVDAQAGLQLLQQGWTLEQVGEIVAHVALNTFSNYFKHLADLELDFPAPPALRTASAAPSVSRV